VVEGAVPAPAETSGPLDGSDVESLVRAERVRALFDRNGVAQATVLVNSAIAVVVLWGYTSPTRLLAWAGALWGIAAVRLAVGVAFRRVARAPDEVARWERRYTSGAAANGVVWGAAPLVLGAGLPLAHVVFLAFVLGGMAAGAAVSNTSRQSAFLAFTLPALLPIVLVLLMGGERLRVGMGVLLAIFGVAVYALARSGGRALEEAVRLRFAKAELAGQLAVLNAELEARVAARSAQLEAAGLRALEAERQLSKTARLAMLGTLAGGVAHEINNPLTYLKANLSYVREELSRLGASPAVRAALDEALVEAGDGVERVRRIVRHLMLLTRVEPAGELRPVDLHAALDLCTEIVRREVQPRARLLRDYGTVPPVLGDQARLVQVFLNILYNAAQAIPDGDPTRNEIRISTRVDPGAGEVIVDVADTGCGIPAANLDRIWDPFFTTKPPDQGTGLGLSICRNLLASLGGRIAVRSMEGVGSTFTVWLEAAPLAQAAGGDPARGAGA
jgi:signal transduction histidine kinase